MRKHKKDDTTDYSDNDDRWNNGTYKVDVTGIVESVGRPKSYHSRYQGVAPVMKYFMSLKRGRIHAHQKVMVNCDSDERQNNIPAAGSMVHFKCTKDGEWISIAAGSPFEFWGKIHEEPEEVYITDQDLKISSVRARSVLVEWYQEDGAVLKAFFPKSHVRLKGDDLESDIEECDQGKAVEVSEWIWNKKLEGEDWKGVVE